MGIRVPGLIIQGCISQVPGQLSIAGAQAPPTFKEQAPRSLPGVPEPEASYPGMFLI